MTFEQPAALKPPADIKLLSEETVSLLSVIDRESLRQRGWEVADEAFPQSEQPEQQPAVSSQGQR